jgi:hypothetical protein
MTPWLWFLYLLATVGALLVAFFVAVLCLLVWGAVRSKLDELARAQ